MRPRRPQTGPKPLLIDSPDSVDDSRTKNIFYHEEKFFKKKWSKEKFQKNQDHASARSSTYSTGPYCCNSFKISNPGHENHEKSTF